MKQLFGLVFLLALVGIGGFLYRNTLEQPYAFHGNVASCSLEARLCPDGTSVGRQGPECSFAACPLPNYALTELGISFVLPPGYVLSTEQRDTDVTATFGKPSRASDPHVISIRALPLPEGQTAEQVMRMNTVYGTSGEPVRAMSEFTPRVVNGRTFQAIAVDRFEAQVHSVYYLPRTTDVLRFDLWERDVERWAEPSLVVSDLPEHQALERLLKTLQVF